MFVTKRRFWIAFIGFTGLLLHDCLLAKTITIKQDGSGDYTKIQSGIEAASDGDTIVVHPGMYIENLNPNGKNLVMGSLYLITADTNYISNTVIDGNNSGSVILLEKREDLNTVIVGFTIQNSASANAGISLHNSGATIKRCKITENNGQGIYALNDSYSIIDGNWISNNGAMGIYFGYSARGIVRNNFITANSTGISIYKTGPSIIEDNVISSNQFQGIEVDESGCTIKFSLISNNGHQGIYCSTGTQIINCTIANNAIGIFADTYGTGNISNSIVWGMQTRILRFDQMKLFLGMLPTHLSKEGGQELAILTPIHYFKVEFLMIII